MANGTIHRLGTLFVNGVMQPRPTNPWNGAPAWAPAAGNIPAYSSGNIEIRDTDPNQSNQIQWVEVNINGTQLLVADRCILRSVPWNTLNAQGLVFGTEVAIDGTLYLLRSLTGGTRERTEGVWLSGGTPTNNEWDQIFTNESALPALPTPVANDLVEGPNATQFSGAHNQLWNWVSIWTWCQETSANDSANRVTRGNPAARRWSSSLPTNTLSPVGWRPCLEALGIIPLISDSDRNLGEFAVPPSVEYSVTEGEGRTFSIVERLNGTQIRSLTNQVDGTFTLTLTPQQWAAAPLGLNTLTIAATNTVGTTTRTLTFTKTNTPPPPPVINSITNGMRLPGTGFVEFTPGPDADGDTQTMTLQFAADSAFTTGLVAFTTGLQRLDGSTWTNATNVPPAQIGSRFRLPYNGIPLNQAQFVRVVADDGQASTASDGVNVLMGDVLEFKTWPVTRDTRPASIFVLLDAVFSAEASVQVFVSNNANDATPTWEDATLAYQLRQPYMFQNTTNTAGTWALSMHVIVNANNATGLVEVSRVGKGVQ